MLTTILPRQKKNLSNISITVHTPPDILSKSEPDIYLVKSSRFPSGWYTTFAGNDYRENDKRAWSSYCELSYPFSVKDVDMSIEAGFTPWEGFYSNKFNVVNIGLSATKELKITSGFSFLFSEN